MVNIKRWFEETAWKRERIATSLGIVMFMLRVMTYVVSYKLFWNFVCMFVCWVNKTRAVKPLRRFHSWILSFTQDGPAFSTKTTRRALQFQLR